MFRDRRERVFLIELPLGRPAEVRDEHEAGAPGERVPDSGQRSADARIVDYFPGLDWNVEIHPHEDPLFAQVEIRHFEDGHEKFGSATTCSTGFQRAFINATVASSIRLL